MRMDALGSQAMGIPSSTHARCGSKTGWRTVANAATEKQRRAEAFWSITRLIEPLDREGAPPFIYTRSDGHPLLYGQSVNILFGKPGQGKSFVSLDVMREVIAKGGRVIYVDYEDRPHTVHDRAVSMGAEGEFMQVDCLRYVDPAFIEAHSWGAMEWLLEAPHPEYSLVVIDAAESAGCPSDGAAVMEWFEANVFPWWRAGAGVLLIDHTPKRKVQNDTVYGPIGSQGKLGAVKGVALLCFGTSWTRKRDGMITLAVHKDRAGYVGQQGATIATIDGKHVMENGRRILKLTVSEPHGGEDAAETADNVERTMLLALDDAGPQGIKGSANLRKAVGFRGEAVHAAMKTLEGAGLIYVDKSQGTHIYVITPAGKREVHGAGAPDLEYQEAPDGGVF